MHAREVDRGLVCLACAMEATGRAQATIYRWRDADLVYWEKVAGRVYFNLSELLEVEARIRPGRRAADAPE